MKKRFVRSKADKTNFTPSVLGKLERSRMSNAEKWSDFLFQPLRINDQAMALRFQPRLNLIWTLFALSFVLLMLRLAFLQIGIGEQYLLAAEGNRVRDQISYAPRGNIYDRNGKILARNRADFQLTVTPYLLPRDAVERQLIYRQVSALSGISADDLSSRSEEEGLNHTLPVLVAEHLDHTTAIRIEQDLPQFDGFSIDVIPVRDYVRDGGLAHVLGYVSRVTQEDLQRRHDVIPTDFIGRGGIEAQYDEILRGKNGKSREEVDSLGRPIRLLSQIPTTQGTDITLTIDYDVQVELERQLREQMQSVGATKASAVMMDPNSGEILAMVSLPSFDNNMFSAGLTQQQYGALVSDPSQPLHNKAIGGAYPTGSTIKPLVASAALQEGVVTPDTIVVDRGSISVGNFTFRGWRPEGLGPMNVRRAIAMSSNIYFYTVGGGHGGQAGVGEQKLTDYYRQFGLGEKTGIDIPGETTGLVPDDEWKRRVKNEAWYLGDTYNISIGQGDLKASPLQMVVAHSAVANGGKVLQPRLLKRVHDDATRQPAAVVRKTVGVDNAHLQVVREGMHEMVYKGAYCACRFASIPVEIAGKTGTAETDKLDPDSYPHSWFIANGPWDEPRATLGVMIEEGQKSANALNPVVNTLSYFFNNR